MSEIDSETAACGGVRILVVDDEEIALKTMCHILKKEGYSVTGASDGVKALAALSGAAFDVVLTDLFLGQIDGLSILARAKEADPGTEVIIITGFATVDAAVAATRKGAFHFLQKPIKPDEVRNITALAVQKRLLENRVLELEQAVAGGVSSIVGTSPRITAIKKLIGRIAASDSNVLITGESGTGKELAARALHNLSRRAKRPFVAINCASFTEALLGNELFGHERDAYTGATATKPGLLESAHLGSVFFDELGDMPLSMQAKLLRAVQEREILRVGGTRPVNVDIRVIAATNRDLKNLCEIGSFRQDLYYRVNVISINMPSLSERREDIPLLASFFLKRCAKSANREISGFSEEAMEILCRYDFPGNVRELQNIVERASALARGETVRACDLPPDLTDVSPYAFHSDEGRIKPLETVEKDYIEWVLRQTGYNKTRAAEALGIDRVSLYRKIRKYALKD